MWDHSKNHTYAFHQLLKIITKFFERQLPEFPLEGELKRRFTKNIQNRYLFERLITLIRRHASYSMIRILHTLCSQQLKKIAFIHTYDRRFLFYNILPWISNKWSECVWSHFCDLSINIQFIPSISNNKRLLQITRIEPITAFRSITFITE